MNNIKHFSICLFLLTLGTRVQSQTNTFQAAVVAGISAAQINGDLLAGFNKVGLHGGLRVSVDFREKLRGSLELLLSQRGSRSELSNSDPRKIHLNYIELPILVGYKDWLKDDYYRILFEGGLSYARLFSSNVDVVGVRDQVDEFSENDIAYLLGVTYFSNEKLGYSFRYSNSLNFLLNQPDQPEFGRLRNFWLTFRMMYRL